MNSKLLIEKSNQYRQKILKYIVGANAGHTGGSLSCIDILNVLYNEVLNVSPETFTSPDRDRYIQSKGALRRSIIRGFGRCWIFSRRRFEYFV